MGDTRLPPTHSCAPEDWEGAGGGDEVGGTHGGCPPFPQGAAEVGAEGEEAAGEEEEVVGDEAGERAEERRAAGTSERAVDSGRTGEEGLGDAGEVGVPWRSRWTWRREAS